MHDLNNLKPAVHTACGQLLLISGVSKGDIDGWNLQNQWGQAHLICYSLERDDGVQHGRIHWLIASGHDRDPGRYAALHPDPTLSLVSHQHPGCAAHLPLALASVEHASTAGVWTADGC